MFLPFVIAVGVGDEESIKKCGECRKEKKERQGGVVDL